MSSNYLKIKKQYSEIGAYAFAHTHIHTKTHKKRKKKPMLGRTGLNFRI
jgi:hypothetical protein